ncbi:MAG: fimbrillin family protein [Paraprevotella sp.]|nr:fimbrillin family protein [Paraprevotella sp.]
MNTIVKTLYIILGGTLLLSSCAQEEAPIVRTEGNDRRIIFHSSLPEVTSRASKIATTLDYFYMTVFDESDNKLISDGKLIEYVDSLQINKTAGSDTYISDNCVWPVPGQESDRLHFFAYYPTLNDGASLVNATSVDESNKTVSYKVKDFQVAPDIADQIDFVTAYTAGSMDDNQFSGIALKFRHQLSRIEVKVKGSHKSCDIEIAGVQIVNALMNGAYEFQTAETEDGKWQNTSPDTAKYIFREGDAIVKVGADPVSILGKKIGDSDNCAMLIPSTYSAWDYTNDAVNSGKGLYLNVLLRIIDKTPTAGKGKVQYPYFDRSQGLNAMDIPREYFAVVKATSVISKRLYKNGNNYFTDEYFTQPYSLASGEEIIEFGWAALPIAGEWEPGYIYTYTLDYTSGIGLHGPEVIGNVSPKAGDPIISDKIGVSVSVNEWQGLNGSTTHTVEVPGA